MSKPLHSFQRRPLRLTPRRLVLALATCSLVGAAGASPTLPTGLQVAQGQASAVTKGNQLTITNSNGAILNWSSFSIGAANAVNFVQPSSTSQVLNRVTGNDPSQILGSLSSNGRVWLLNPNGVLFGQGAQVNVAGLVTSTLNLNDQDWTAGRYLFTAPATDSPAASIVNQGQIRSSSGGQVLMLAGEGGVRNEGVIEAPGGQIVLAAGNSIELMDTATPRVTVKVTAPEGEVVNLGSVTAAGGRIDVQAATVNQQGIVRADALSVGPSGEIVINASNRLTLAAGSTTSADSASGTAGQIELLGNQVALLNGSVVSASGTAGGGTVLVGGGAQGKDASVPNADAVYFAPGASISADATSAGDGGHIVLWSNSSTRAYGTLSAVGGPQGGNGGLVETSGGWLDAQPLKLDVSAPKGHAGQWLLDPFNVTIGDSEPDVNYDTASFTATGNDATISTGAISTQLSDGTSVTVSTGGGTTGQSGTISMSGTISVSSGQPGALALIADSDITLTNATISSSVGPLPVTLKAGRAGAGGISLFNSHINSNGGDILLTGYATGQSPQGSGQPTFTGASSSSGLGVVISQSTIVAGTSAGQVGNVTINGVGTSGDGVDIDGATVTGNNLTINGSSSTAVGVSISNSSLLSSFASMLLSGYSGGNNGVLVTGGSSLTAGNAVGDPEVTMTLVGESASAGGDPGLLVGSDTASVLTVLNGAAMNLTGYYSGSVSAPFATQLSGMFDASQGGALTVKSGAGSSVMLYGVSMGGSAAGISINSGSTLTTTANGSVMNNIAVAGPGGLSLLAGADISASDLNVVSSGSTGSPIVLQAGLSGLGSISLADSTLSSNGGSIVFTGPATGQLPVSGTFTGASGSSGIGVSIQTSTISAGNTAGQAGDVTINGVGTSGDGVEIYGGSVQGNRITINGSSSGGFGVAIEDASLSSFASLLANGYSVSNSGILLIGDSNLSAGNAPGGSGVTMNLVGQTASSQSGNFGLFVDLSSGELSALNNASIGLIGYAPGNQSNGIQFTGIVDASQGGGSISVTSGLGSNVYMDSASLNGSAAGVSINSSGAVQLLEGSISAPGAGAVTVQAVSDITLDGFTIGSTGGALPISLLSGSGGTGSVTVGNSTLTSNGGSITLGGFGSGTLPQGGSFSQAAVGTTDSGVSVTDSSINAGTSPGAAGTVTISGVSDSGPGVYISQSSASNSIQGGNILINGSANSGTGVTIESTNLSTTGNLTVQGYSASSVGLVISDTSSLTASPAVSAPGNALSLVGGSGSSIAVIIEVSGDGAIVAGNGTAMTVSGTTGTPGEPALDLLGVFDTSTGGGMSINVFGANTNSAIVMGGGSLTGSSAGINVNAGSLLTLQNTQLSSTGAIQLLANTVYLNGTTTISSSKPSGDAILLAGSNGNPMTSFINTASSSSVLSTSGGRWIVWASDVGNESSFDPGTLAYDFTVYGATTPAAWAGISGNGFASATSVTATLSGSALSKIYDGTTTASPSQVTLEASNITGTIGAGASWQFDTKNVGSDKTVTLSNPSVVNYLDSNDKPVYGVSLSGNLTGNITAAPLTGFLTAGNKTYDGGTTASVSVSNLSGFVGSETVNVSASGSFADKNVGQGKPVSASVALSDGTNGGLASNYFFSGNSGLSASITPANLVVSGLTANSKTYDATLAATLSGSPVFTPLGTDQVSLAGGPVGQFSDKNVGTAKPVSVTGYSLSGTDAGNYVLVEPTGLTASITPASLVVSGLSANSKVYDATTAATLSGSASVTLLGQDVASLSGTSVGSFADKNVGSAKPVSVSGLSLAGTDAGNYVLVTPGLQANITPASLVVGGLSAVGKVYDGITTATLSGTATVTPLGSDQVTVDPGAAGFFADKNAGVNKPVSVFYLSLSGPDAGNYTVVAPTNLSATITPLSLTVSGLSAQNKVYDTTTLATLAGSASVTPLTGDTVSLTGTASGSFADKNVGTAKPVSVSGLSLTGIDAGNYTVAEPTGLTASIIPAILNVGGISANSKVYDATTAATLRGSASVTPLGSDSVSVGGTVTASFADKNVGTSKPVSVLGLTLSGADAGNYTLAAPTLQADITPASLAVSGLSAASKVYDATVTATLTGTASVTPLGADQVSVSGSATGSFADKNVGTNKQVVVSSLTLSGADAGNYIVVAPTSLTASITPANLLVSGLSAQSKTYDATTVAHLSGNAVVTPLGGDSVSVAGSPTGSFANKNVGTSKAVTLTGLTLSGPDAGNYTPVSPTTLVATISPAILGVNGLAANNKVYDGTTTATLSGGASVTPLAGDSVSLGGNPQAAFSDKNAGSAKLVSLTGLLLTGADASNYTLATPTLLADITPAILNITGLSASSKVYDGTTTATLFGTPVVTPIGNDQVSVAPGAAIGVFSNKNVGSNKTVTVSPLSLTGADAGNYTPVAPTTLTANITPANLFVNGLSAQNKTYDQTTTATLTGSASVSPIAGDSVSLAGTAVGAFADKNAGSFKPVLVSGLSLTGADAGNYTVVEPNLVATIAPYALALSGLSANIKVYDGSTAASMSGTPAVTPLPGDQVNIAGTPLGSFSDRNVGTEKTVSYAGGLSLTGPDGGNYTITSPGTYSAAITAATLSYVATPAFKAINDPVPPLTGTVSGFVGGDTQGSATTGSLAFTTDATAASPVGSYAINGSGLSAQNYVFVQAPGNATALTVALTAPSPSTSVTQSVNVALNSAAVPTIAATSSSTAGLLDLTAAPGAGVASSAALAAATASPSTAFGALPLGSMSMDALATLLAVRDRYKQNLFADAVYKLKEDPKLADVRSCSTLSEAGSGGCLITADLKRQSQAHGTPVLAEIAPAETAAPSAALPSWLNAANRRRIKMAALPQIERKVAVVIGVDEYQDKTIPSLGNAVNDAQSVGKIFEDRLGYETVVIPNASKAAVIGTLNRLALTMGPKDSVVIYYAGHGDLVEQTGQGYWLLSDADATKPETWLSNADIGRLINQIGASQVALISDSCYSGSLVSDERIRASSAPIDPAKLLSQKSVVVMSSGGNEPVSDAGKDGHSPFAYNLMSQLSQLSQWQAGGNVFERVRFAVARELPQRPQYGASSAAGHQVGGDYLFEQRQLDPSSSQ